MKDNFETITIQFISENNSRYINNIKIRIHKLEK